MPASAPVLADVRLVELGQPIFEAIPRTGPHGDVRISRDRPFLPGIPDGCLITITRVDLAVHVGTHVDTPRHFYERGKSIDDYPLDRFVRPAVVCDLRREGPVPVSAKELAAALPLVDPGDSVLFCFGYGARIRDPGYLDHPYLTEEAAEYLVSVGAGAVGVDVLTPDMPAERRPPGFDWPAHRILLGNDVLIYENLGPGLERIVGRRLLVAAPPIRVEGADGALVAPYAFLPDEEAA
jgi:arylformamidase